MSELSDILIENQKRYPLSSAQDVLKLIYQNEFGCGHLVSDEEACRERIKSEWENSAFSGEPLMEHIGNGFTRVNIAAAAFLYANSLHSVGQLAAAFYLSAQALSGTKEHFMQKVLAAARLCNDGSLSQNAVELLELANKWEAEGEKPFSHSDTYRAAYSPAYRVLTESYANAFLIAGKINLLHAPYTVVAIDGRCASGKTTLASCLSKLTKASTVHMDDFFLPKKLRTKKRLAAPGGNVHYERFLHEVAPYLKSGKPFSYGHFDCERMKCDSSVSISPAPVIIVEGSYCLHQKLCRLYDIKVLCSVDPAVQEQRLIKREGEIEYRRFASQWIPLEEAYLPTLDAQEDILRL